MFKKLMLLLLTGCLILFIGCEAFAVDTAGSGDNQSVSTVNANADTINTIDKDNTSNVSLKSDQTKNINDNYRPYREHHHGYWGPRPGAALLLIFVSMMVFLILLS